MSRVPVMIVIALLAAPVGADDGATPTLDDLAWLAGEWVRETRRGVVIERWERVSPDTMEGIATLQVGETVHPTEFLRIERLGDQVYYVAKPRENPFPTPFQLNSADDNGWVFENTDHDFPQRIVYLREGDDSLLVRIEGPMDGEVRSMEFRFKRKP